MSDILFLCQHILRLKFMTKSEIADLVANIFEQEEVEAEFFLLRDLAEILQVDYNFKMARTTFNTLKKMKTALADMCEVIMILDVVVPNLNFAPKTLEKIPVMKEGYLLSMFSTRMCELKDGQCELAKELNMLSEFVKNQSSYHGDMGNLLSTEIENLRSSIQQDMNDLIFAHLNQRLNQPREYQENGRRLSLAKEMDDVELNSKVSVSNCSFVSIIDESVKSDEEIVPTKKMFSTPKKSDIIASEIAEIATTNGLISKEMDSITGNNQGKSKGRKQIKKNAKERTNAYKSRETITVESETKAKEAPQEENQQMKSPTDFSEILKGTIDSNLKPSSGVRKFVSIGKKKMATPFCAQQQVQSSPRVHLVLSRIAKDKSFKDIIALMH